MFYHLISSGQVLERDKLPRKHPVWTFPLFCIVWPNIYSDLKMIFITIDRHSMSIIDWRISSAIYISMEAPCRSWMKTPTNKLNLPVGQVEHTYVQYILIHPSTTYVDDDDQRVPCSTTTARKIFNFQPYLRGKCESGRQAGKQADQTACSVIRVPRQRQFSRIVATHKLLSDKFASLSIKPLKKKKKEKDRLEIKGYVANTPRGVSLIKGEIPVLTKWSVKLSPFPIPSNCRRNCNRSSCLVNEWNWKSCPRRSFRVSLFLCPFLSIDWKQEEGLFPAINLQ